MEGFKEFVEKNWEVRCNGSSMDTWQKRLRNIRQKIKGWVLNANAMYRKRKKELLNMLDMIDKNAELRGINAQERIMQKELRRELKEIFKLEEIKWLQRYKDKEIKEGDSNTRYYHAKVNGRRRMNMIVRLEQDEGVIEGEKELIEYITTFYKNLFGQAENSTINLNIQGSAEISPQTQDELVKDFSMEEIREVVFSMEKKQKPRP